MRGIQLLPSQSNKSSLAAHLSLSNGTTSVAGLQSLRQPYVADAFVPTPPWRSLNNEEKELLIGDRPVEGEWIRIVRVPEKLLRLFVGLKAAIASYDPSGSVRAWMHSRDYHNALQVVIHDLESSGATPIKEGAGINTNQPGLVTSTVNGKTGQFVGLHVDSFFHRDIENRPCSPGRICINLGLEDRFLLFINLPLLAIADIFARSGILDSRVQDSGRALSNLFLERFPDYPVVRVRVAPGEAYIAHTENMVHDGSTEEQKTIDVILTVLGNMPADLYDS